MLLSLLGCGKHGLSSRPGVLTDPPYLSVLYDREIPDDQPADATEANQVFFKRAGLSDEIKVVTSETTR